MIETLAIIVFSIILIFVLSIVALTLYRKSKYHKKQVERSLNMVPFKITISKETGQEKIESGTRNHVEVARELIAVAENMYNSFFALYSGGIKNIFKNFIYRPMHISLEIVAHKKAINFYIAVPYLMSGLVEKAVTAAYPEAQIKETEEHNIFDPKREMNGISGGYAFGYKDHRYPIKTYQAIENEPLETLTNALSMLEEDEGAAIQLLIRPVNPKKMLASKSLVKKIQKGPGNKTTAMDMVSSVIDPKTNENKKPDEPYRTTPLEEQIMKEVDRKASKFGYETRFRVVIAAESDLKADLLWKQMKSALAQYSDLSINGFKIKKEKDKDKLVTDYIFRFFDDSIFNFERFWPKQRGYRLVLNTEELASIYHFPNALVKTPGIEWLAAKAQQIPVNLPTEGIKFAKATFRGDEEDVMITEYDKMRHVYIIGQTGTGKTVLMKNMMESDILAGGGLCFIDPHGDGVEDMLSRIPKERAEDVVIFDASDVERPLGLNLFEARSIEQKDLVIQEAITMLYRLYDPGHQGIMGPRFEHWFRNAALALMADPEGGTFIEVPRIFTDDAYLAQKLKHVQDPVVRNFWINEMGQTADFHKSEVLGWFVGKFGAFMTNTTMRNILGQVKSSLNLREIMDNKKILLVNLSKGLIGEMNMQLLGMIFISKIQMAAMSRAEIPEPERVPFALYVDEFQNFVTDNISAILSESRKYKLSLIMANQFIGQLRDDIKAAVFGNVGTMISFRIGAEDGEFVEKQFNPEFESHDLINQENLHAIIKMTINGLPSRPFSIIDYFPPKLTDNDKKRGQAIKELARLKYGQPRDVVDAELQEKMNIKLPQTIPGGLPREGGGGG